MSLSNYSPAVDLAYSQYHALLLESVAIRARIDQLSKDIDSHGETVPSSGTIDYSRISSLLTDVEKMMYPVTEDWVSKILFCLRRFNAQRIASLTYEQIVSYISDAEKLANNTINQGMVGAIKVTLDGMVERDEVQYANGRYFQ